MRPSTATAVPPSITLRLLILAILAIAPLQASAQIPQTINHQGKLIDDEGDPIDGFVKVHLSLYDAETDGSLVWAEDHAIEVVDGVFDVDLGSEEPLDKVAFDAPLWLGIIVNEGAEMVPRLPLTSVPYSFRAKRIDSSALEAGENIILDDDGGVIRINAVAPEVGTISSLDAADGEPTNVVTVDEKGWVGIGTNAPGFPLEVAGDIGALEDLVVQGQVIVEGNVTVQSNIQSQNDIEAQGELRSLGDVRLSDDLLFDSDQGTIRFAKPTKSNAPMMELFPSGTNNPTRMVISHSPAFQDWGVAYNDTTDAFHWLSDGSPVLSVALGARRVGIGTTTPTERLHVKGSTLIEGDLDVTGKVSKSSGSFRIDHPLDPANRYLYHSFVESPDMMNVYNGNVVLDEKGEARIELPPYFEALNRDFRYQLTCIGGFAPVYVAEKIAGNSFRIAGGHPGMEVSWQVTGIRNDPYAAKNRIEVEVDKPESERGTYLFPQGYSDGNLTSRQQSP